MKEAFGVAPCAALLEQVPARIAVHYRIFPAGLENGILKVFISHGTSQEIRAELAVVLGRMLDFEEVSSGRITEYLERFYGLGAEKIEALADSKGMPQTVSTERKVLPAGENLSGMAGWVEQLFADAVNLRASDIHIEPFSSEKIRIRYRIDGVLREVPIPTSLTAFASHLTSRIKIMAGLDISEKRLPQDGRIQVSMSGKLIDLRVSVIPASEAESIVIRILKPLEFLSLEDLGFTERSRQMIIEILKRPNGIFLLTGPTGSGKTTTLYACLKLLNQTERKIITVEDPVEYKLPGILQIQVNPKINFDFAGALRFVLRHDPDILMIGEIRDRETAEIAVRAAMTGHLVLSTIHTNDAPSALARLMEMGIEASLLSSTIEAVMAQRLIRRKCQECDPEIFSNRCGKCQGTGFYGRLAISEIFQMDAKLRQAVLEKKSPGQLRDLSRERGMESLYEDGMKKSAQGLTMEEEIRRVAMPEKKT